MTTVSVIVSLVCLLLAGFFGFRLYQWENLLRRSRIVVAYRNKVKMNSPLIDWLTWCRRVDKDKHTNGQVVFLAGGVKIAVLRKVSRDHGKTVTKPVTDATRNK